MAALLQYGDGPKAIYDAVKEKILSGELAGGAEVKIQALAADMGVSIVPVREAIRMLASDGFIDIRPRRSPVVSSIELADVLEINQIRQALEPLALEAAVPNHTLETLDACRAIVAEDEIAQDLWHKVELNRRFHLALLGPAGQPRILRLIEDQYDGISRFAQFLVVGSGVFEGAPHREHQRLLEAVERRDTAEAMDLMRDHLAASTDRVRAALEEREVVS